MKPSDTVYIKLGQAEGALGEALTLAREARTAAVDTDLFDPILKITTDLGILRLKLGGLAAEAEKRFERGPA